MEYSWHCTNVRPVSTQSIKNSNLLSTTQHPPNSCQLATSSNSEVHGMTTHSCVQANAKANQMSDSSAEVAKASPVRNKARPHGFNYEALIQTQLHYGVRGVDTRCGCQVRKSKDKQNKEKGRRHRAGGRKHRAGGRGSRADLHDDATQGALQSGAHNGCSLPPHAFQPFHQQGPSPLHILLPLVPPPCIPAPPPVPLSSLQSQWKQTGEGGGDNSL